MAEEKQANSRTVHVTVRVSAPRMTIPGMVTLEALIAEIVAELDGATYDVSIATPRPERQAGG